MTYVISPLDPVAMQKQLQWEQLQAVVNERLAMGRRRRRKRPTPAVAAISSPAGSAVPTACPRKEQDESSVSSSRGAAMTESTNGTSARARSQAQAAKVGPASLLMAYDDDAARRFGEVVDYALERLARETGAQLGAQKRLAEILGASTTMVHRYRVGKTDFRNIKVSSLVQLADACDLDIGTVYRWVVHGRDAAMAHERQITGRPKSVAVEDIYRELGRALQLTAEPPLPVLQRDALRCALEEQRAQAPAMFDRLAQALNAGSVLENIAKGDEELLDDDWSILSSLLDCSVGQLKDTYYC